MTKVLLTVVLLTLIGVAAPAQSQSQSPPKEGGDACIMYGDDHVFALKLPKGWVVNPQIGKSLGLHAVMYPDGSSWEGSVVTMYSSFVHKTQKLPDIEQIIADDIAEYKKASPNIKAVDTGTLPLGSGKEKVVVKYFSGGVGNNFEAVAYIDESKVVVMIVLTSKTEIDFKATIPAFKEMVGSYRFISENVTAPQ